MNKTISDILTRRSIRKFKPEQITREELDIVLEAGKSAPTARNFQSPIIVAVQNKEDIAYITKLNAAVMGSTADTFYGAPTVIVVFADRGLTTHVEDGSLVLGNLMNAAAGLGLGSCWINRAKEVFEMPEARKIARKAGIGDEYIGIGNCILGYVDGELPEAKQPREGRVFHI